MKHPNQHVLSTSLLPTIPYKQNIETPAQIATRTNKDKVITSLSHREALQRVRDQIEKLGAPYTIISCDGTKILSTHISYTVATEAIEDTCDVLVFASYICKTYVPAPVRNCSAEIAGLAVVNFGSAKKSCTNKATKEHNLEV